MQILRESPAAVKDREEHVAMWRDLARWRDAAWRGMAGRSRRAWSG
jgi:hypothetical protein